MIRRKLYASTSAALQAPRIRCGLGRILERRLGLADFLRHLGDRGLLPGAGDTVAHTRNVIDRTFEQALHYPARRGTDRTANQRPANQERAANVRRNLHGLVVILDLEASAPGDAAVGRPTLHRQVLRERIAILEREQPFD